MGLLIASIFIPLYLIVGGGYLVCLPLQLIVGIVNEDPRLIEEGVAGTLLWYIVAIILLFTMAMDQLEEHSIKLMLFCFGAIGIIITIAIWLLYTECFLAFWLLGLLLVLATSALKIWDTYKSQKV